MWTLSQCRGQERSHTAQGNLKPQNSSFSKIPDVFPPFIVIFSWHQWISKEDDETLYEINFSLLNKNGWIMNTCISHLFTPTTKCWTKATLGWRGLFWPLVSGGIVVLHSGGRHSTRVPFLVEGAWISSHSHISRWKSRKEVQEWVKPFSDMTLVDDFCYVGCNFQDSITSQKKKNKNKVGTKCLNTGACSEHFTFKF